MIRPSPVGGRAGPWFVKKERRGARQRARSPLDQLEEDHLRRVRATRPELEDAGVAAGALRVARGDLLEELVDRELVLPELAQRLTARVQVALLGQRDELLHLGLDGLGLRLGRLDALVL